MLFHIFFSFLANSVTVTTPQPPSIELPKPNQNEENDEVPDDNESTISKEEILNNEKKSELLISAKSEMNKNKLSLHLPLDTKLSTSGESSQSTPSRWKLRKMNVFF